MSSRTGWNVDGFFYGSDLFDCWNLCFFSPAIYVIAGTGDSHIGTTDRRFELHSPLSLVSKKRCVIVGTFIFWRNMLFSKSFGSETFW